MLFWLGVALFGGTSAEIPQIDVKEGPLFWCLEVLPFDLFEGGGIEEIGLDTLYASVSPHNLRISPCGIGTVKKEIKDCPESRHAPKLSCEN